MICLMIPHSSSQNVPSLGYNLIQNSFRTNSGIMENFDSLAEDVVGDIIKKACEGVEERLEALEDDIWPRNEDYSEERGMESISRCLYHKYI